MISYVNKTYIKLDFVELRSRIDKGQGNHGVGIVTGSRRMSKIMCWISVLVLMGWLLHIFTFMSKLRRDRGLEVTFVNGMVFGSVRGLLNCHVTSVIGSCLF